MAYVIFFFGTVNATEQASKWPVVNLGTHMTLAPRDLMYKLWYVLTICEVSQLESNFLLQRW